MDEYYITNVDRKNGKMMRHVHWYALNEGPFVFKEINIGEPVLFYKVIKFEDGTDPCMKYRFHTSVVLRVEYNDDEIVIETFNTTYKLKKK